MSKKLLFILFALLLGAAQPLEAQRRSPAKNADTAFERGQYSLAIERYKKAVKRMKKKKYEGERMRITYQLGECYRLTDNTKQAATQYKRVLKSEFPKSTPVFYLHYGDVLKRNEKYDEALEMYNIYSELVPDDPRGQRAAADIANIKEWLEYPSKYEVTRVKALNSKSSDFGIAWISNSFNDVIFTSTREGGVAKEKDGRKAFGTNLNLSTRKAASTAKEAKACLSSQNHSPTCITHAALTKRNVSRDARL